MDDKTPLCNSEIIGEAGGLVEGSHLTLGVYGEDLDPEEISHLLGCLPTSAHRRGDTTRSGIQYKKGAWLLSVEAKSPMEPEELVHLLLERLPTDKAIWPKLRSRFQLRLGFGIFIKKWNRGFELSAEAIRRIELLGAGLDFDIYAILEEGDAL